MQLPIDQGGILSAPLHPFVDQRVKGFLRGPSRPFVDKRVLPLPFFVALRGPSWGVAVAVLRGPSRPFVDKRVLPLPFFVALRGPSRPFVDKKVLPLPFFVAPRGPPPTARIPSIPIPNQPIANNPQQTSYQRPNAVRYGYNQPTPAKLQSTCTQIRIDNQFCKQYS